MMIRIGSLCTGYGGLDLAVEQVFGGRTIWTADIDKHASKVIAARFPDAPNLGDIKKINWSDVPDVDVITGGYPCQPFSHAGKREGVEDERHIWPWIMEGVRTIRPRWCVFENVGGHLSLGLGDVVKDLAEAGFLCGWSSVRAADVGAPHGRLRVFILAVREDAADAGSGQLAGSAADGNRLQQPAEHGVGPVSLLPTPTAQAAKHGGTPDVHANGYGSNLWDLPHLLPTPKSSNNENRQSEDRYGPNLGMAVNALLPTPRASDGPNGQRSLEGQQNEIARGRNKNLGMLPVLLPTPDASAHKYRLGGGESAVTKPGSTSTSRRTGLLPTPTARDHKDGLTARHGVTGAADLLPRAIGELLDE